MALRLILAFAFSVLLVAAPAEAAALGAAGAKVSEGSSLTLFAIGLAGLLLGRRIATSRRPDADSEGEDH